MNDYDKATLAAAIEKVLLLFAAVVITILGGIVGGMIPFYIVALFIALFFPGYPEMSVLGIVPALISAPIGLFIAGRFCWDHLVKKSTDEGAGRISGDTEYPR